MPKITFSVPHEMSATEARERVETFLPRVEEQYKDMIKDMSRQWNGDVLEYSFKTLGFVFKGTIALEEKQVTVNMDVPLAAMMVKGRIEQEFKAGLERLLLGKKRG
ncbi:MAG: polyhydroxyalkanoic acid system family protein [Planctomycetes bacterium]|nr:polyhydroxyalkanoic acid system family protein [Planctomycetota bacterium]